MKMISFLWLLPFTFFLGGYILVAYIVGTPTLETPHCVGKNIQQALRILTNYDLNAKLLEEKEDNDIPRGTVIAQRPTYKQKIKPQQTVFLVVSKKSPTIPAPPCVGKKIADITQDLKNNNILHKNYSLPSEHPHDTCIAQLPRAGMPLQEKKIIIYASSTTPQPVIFPNLIQHTATEGIDFLKEYHITPYLSHSKLPDKNHACIDCTITDQKPLAGSIIHLDRPLDVHLHINHK